MTETKEIEIPSYGVCDSPQQFYKRFSSHFQKNPEYFWMTCVQRKDQPEWGGWRWHKWGEYVGEHEIEHEYIYDSDIDEQYLFSKEYSEVGGLPRYNCYLMGEDMINLGEYATSWTSLKSAEKALVKFASMDIKDIAKASSEPEYMMGKWKGYGKNYVVYLQGLGYEADFTLQKLTGEYTRNISNVVNFFLCIHNVEEYTYKGAISKAQKILYQFAIDKLKGEIGFFYSLSTEDQKCVLEHINLVWATRYHPITYLGDLKWDVTTDPKELKVDGYIVKREFTLYLSGVSRITVPGGTLVKDVLRMIYEQCSDHKKLDGKLNFAGIVERSNSFSLQLVM